VLTGRHHLSSALPPRSRRATSAKMESLRGGAIDVLPPSLEDLSASLPSHYHSDSVDE
jgi:hypothetical protein